MKNYITINRTIPSGFNWLYKFYYNISYNNSYQKLPVISLLFSSGLACWIMLLYIGYVIYAKNYRYLIPVSPVFAAWLVMLLGPVVLYRYVYPIFIADILLIASIFTMKKNNN